MNKVIIADTSCLIIFSKINALWILEKLFKNIVITPEIYHEYGLEIPIWIKIESIKDHNIEKLALLNLDKGEASAITLCLEQSTETLLLIDERKGRKIAKELGISILGTLGVLLKAKHGLIIPEVKPYIEKIEATNFWIEHSLKAYILEKCGE